MTESVHAQAPGGDEMRDYQVSGPRLTQALYDRYKELLDGVAAGEPTWITTGGPEGGVNGTLAKLDARQASRDLGGTSVAAHAEHLRWAMKLVNDHFEGLVPTGDWSESWTVKKVNAEAWDRLRADLRRTGERLLENVRERHDWNDDMAMIGALASFGHTAYHLGALRQLMKRAEATEHE